MYNIPKGRRRRLHRDGSLKSLMFGEVSVFAPCVRRCGICLTKIRFNGTWSNYLSQYLTNLMHKICFTISFISCLYMFRAHVLIIRRSKLNYTASDIITPVGDTRVCVMQFWPPDDEQMCSKHVEAWNKLTVKQKFCALCWLITEINILRCTVNKTSKFEIIIFNQIASRIFQLVGLIMIRIPSYMLDTFCKDVTKYVNLINVWNLRYSSVPLLFCLK